MRETKYHAYLDSEERTILLHSLVELKNQLIQQGRYTDCVDELIVKVINAPVKKLKVDLTSTPMVSKSRSNEELADKVGESREQIRRYIRLTELVPEILQMVDERQIAFRPAVEISYLSEEQQYTLLEAMEYNDATPSLAQAIKMKKYMQEGKLTDGVISSIMEEEKPNQREKPAFRDERITKLIPKSVPKGKESDFVVKALEFYNRHLQRSKAQER